MYVCVCNSITDRQIKETVSDGVSTMCGLGVRLGVGTCCGKCAPTARKILQSQLSEMTPDVLAERAVVRVPGHKRTA